MCALRPIELIKPRRATYVVTWLRKLMDRIRLLTTVCSELACCAGDRAGRLLGRSTFLSKKPFLLLLLRPFIQLAWPAGLVISLRYRGIDARVVDEADAAMLVAVFVVRSTQYSMS